MGAFSEVAYAQTSVNIYGIVDSGIVHESGGAAGSVNKLTSGIESGSRLGFRGTEDLGSGLSAIFVLETGFQADTGALGQGGLLFGRQAYVGLNGSFGAMTMGRQYTPNYITMTTVGDPFAAGLAGVFSNVMATSGARMNNAVKYVSPKFNGFNGELVYGFGEVAGTTAASRAIGGAIAYASGLLNVRLAYHNRNNDTDTVKGLAAARNTVLAANYDFGMIKAFAAYGINQGPNSSPLSNVNAYGSAVAPKSSTDSRDFLLGATIPIGVGKVIVSYIHKDDKTRFNQDATQLALGYTYSLSKRTDLYTSYARINNKNGAGYTVGSAIETGSGNSAVNLGVRHTF
ncbi:porin [Glaciimonas sp. PCH181]|nr:porin [Glaciimonas sp. PCH181]